MIPLVSFALQRGKCRGCDSRIGARQPGIEVLAALIGGLMLWMSPDSVGLGGALFGWLLLALFVFDAEHLWLPNVATGLLAAAGLLFGPAYLQDRLIGLVAGFAALELIRQTYRAVRHREGMGGGDPKLLGGIGAWLGWAALPFVLLGASLLGLILIVVRFARGQPISGDLPLPFGALMAASGFGYWIVCAQWPLPF